MLSSCSRSVALRTTLLRRRILQQHRARFLASDSNDERNRRGGSGRSTTTTTTSSSSRSTGAFERFRLQARKNKKKRPPSFAEKFLEPAARGELTKHRSGIPKLAARKPKSKTPHDQFPGKQAQEIMPKEQYKEDDEEEVLEEAQDDELRVAATGTTMGSTDESKSSEQQSSQVQRDIQVFYQTKEDMMLASLPEGYEYAEDDDDDDEGYEPVPPGFFPTRGEETVEEFNEKYYFHNDPTEPYDSDDEYDDWDESLTQFDPDNHPDITKDEDGIYTLHYNPAQEGIATEEDDPEYELVTDDQAQAQDNAPFVRRDRRSQEEQSREMMDVDLEERFFYPDITDFSDPFPGPIPDELVNQVRPLNELGPELDDFLEATYLHPTKFAEVKRLNLPYESRREPQPDIPKFRKHAPFEFLKNHKRFLFVSGLPPKLLEDEEEPDLHNPIHRHELQSIVAELLGGFVPPEQVFMANLTCAFVGFKEKSAPPKVAQEIRERLATNIKMTCPVVMSKYDGTTEYGDFTKESPSCIIQLSEVPSHMTRAKLARDFFPADSELSAEFGPLDVSQVLMTSPTTALIRLQSEEQVESALASESLQKHLQEFGEYPIQFFLAKRERVHAGFTGPNKGSPYKRLGERLIVDGDVPTDKFFRSHAGCILLRNLDEMVTKQDICDLLQPHCEYLRDVSGSVEFVTCMNDNPTGRAFVGFDRLGEAEAFIKAVNGRVMRLGDSPVVAKLVKDRKIPGATPREARPERTEEELLDSLNNWEQYVDPKEIEELEKMGVNRMALDLAFRALRFQNTTYGPMDGALRSETLVPEREAGEEFRETVREYIATVKDCMGTPEDPGMIYEGLHLPGEEIDLSIFDNEKRRQATIKKRLGG